MDIPEITRELERAGILNAAQEARWILKYARGDLGVGQIVGRRVSGEPLSRIIGFQEFYGRDFYLSEATLDPRIDSEVLIDKALEIYADNPPAKVIDLGTGTGCLAITLLKEWPDARCVAVDKSFDAMETARRNAEHHGVLNRFIGVCADWADCIDEKFDLLISNPPYIKSDVIPDLDDSVVKFDPILALDGGVDGLQAYRDIFGAIKLLLKPDGKALLEIGYDQAEDIMRLSKEYKIRVESIHRDSGGNPRVVDISSGDKT